MHFKSKPPKQKTSYPCNKAWWNTGLGMKSSLHVDPWHSMNSCLTCHSCIQGWLWRIASVLSDVARLGSPSAPLFSFIYFYSAKESNSGCYRSWLEYYRWARNTEFLLFLQLRRPILLTIIYLSVTRLTLQAYCLIIYGVSSAEISFFFSFLLWGSCRALCERSNEPSLTRSCPPCTCFWYWFTWMCSPCHFFL